MEIEVEARNKQEKDNKEGLYDPQSGLGRLYFCVGEKDAGH